MKISAVQRSASHFLSKVVICAFGTLSINTPANADNLCPHSVRDCLLYSHNEISSCLLRAAQSSACANSPLGALTELRANLSPSTGEQFIVTVLGTTTTSTSECVRNFDNELASRVIYGDPTEVELRRLAASLKVCITNPAENLK